MEDHIVIRRATRDDRFAVRTVAGRDSRRPPAGGLLVAERDGVIRAYAALDGGDLGADPFHRTADLVDLLRTRVAQLRRPVARTVEIAPSEPCAETAGPAIARL